MTPFFLFAQFTDNFSDGDFTQNPTWTGDTDLFIIENLQLRINSAAGNDSTYLVTPSTVLHDTEWNFWVRLAFTPSDNNHPRIYLVSNSSNLKGSLNGYYIQIGKTGTDNKRIYIFRQDGLQRTEIMVGSSNLATATNNILRIKVLRNNSGHWEVFADPQGGNLFAPEGSANDATHTNTSYFGVFCKYTSSNINRFYFDDFYVGDILVDTIPPGITSAEAISQYNLALLFSEAVNPVSASNISNYSVNQGIGSPTSIIQDISNPARLILDFNTAFIDGQVYTLTVQGVKDLASNTMEPASIDFSYYTVRPYDIVINEIMADPTPEVGLPPHEYIELFNATPYSINLAGWTFRHGTTNRDLPAVSIEGNAYLILGTEEAIAALAQYGSVAVIDGLSSTALTNSGTTLTLYDAQNNIIHSVSYSDEWYQNSAKAEGGWSLEMIDPGNPCNESNNWIVSTDLRGGTPGISNSVKATNPDLEAPWLDRAVISDANTLTLYFSEKMDQTGIANPSNFAVDQEMGIPEFAIPFEPRFDAVSLLFSEAFAEQTVYEVSITGTLSDCAGNPIESGTTTRFADPVFAEPNDLVINEILFNPPTGGIEYVEIYNRSQKVIDLKNVSLASQDTILNQLTSVREIAPAGYLIFPEDYLVLTTSPDLVKKFFMTTNPRGFIKMVSVPQFSNASGIAVLCDPNETILDRLVYREEMHFPLLTNLKGVSLERIDFNRPADDPTNWHSASSSAGYGTPAYRNSQYMAITAGEEPFSLNPEIFSPDNDGNNDVLEISYNFSEPGHVATIMVYDAGGRLVRRLVQNQLLGNTGSFSWNGITDDNEKASIGYYLILIEVFDLNDNIKQYKKTAVLGGRL
ncbi:MAG: lamin tail domain-containing protein [Bacteroidales bacterium]|nr:lamin tail domain-containing protein [Bacteroidales bacterium]